MAGLQLNSADAQVFNITNSSGSELIMKGLRITSGGNVLVGKTTDDDNTTGIRLHNTGFISASRVNNVSLILNRTGTDGSIALFRNDGTQVGRYIYIRLHATCL